MGKCCCKPDADENGTYPWPKEKLELAERSIQCGDPRVMNFRDYQFPIEDPIDMIVKDTETSKEIRLKNYLYPAYYDSKSPRDPDDKFSNNAASNHVDL